MGQGLNDNKEPQTWNVNMDYCFDVEKDRNSMLVMGMGSMEVIVLVDTGAAVSVISEHIVGLLQFFMGK